MMTCALAVFGAISGCHSTGPDYVPTERERLEMLKLMLPSDIEIRPFTKIKSFDSDDLPDGISVVIRPIDRFGDPVKAVGGFQFELWSYRNASGDPKDQQIAFWDRMILTKDDVRTYWNRAQMYEFQLAWTGGTGEIAPGRKYVLVVRYRTPWDETIEDQYVMDFYLSTDSIAGAATP
jgi:hypothetical protein